MVSGPSSGALLLQTQVDSAELAEGAVGAHFCGAHGTLEDIGDLGEGEFLEAREEEHLAVVALELGEGGMEERVVIARGGAMGGVWRVVRVRVQIERIRGVGSRLALAVVIGGAAPREVVHPSGERPVIAVRVAVLQHALEDDLGDIFACGAVARELHEKAEERAVVALEELSERVELAVTDGQHQGVVGALGSGGVHRSRPGAVNRGRMRRNGDFFGSGNHDGGGWTCGVAQENLPSTAWLQGILGLGTVRESILLSPMNRRDFLIRSSAFTAAGLLTRSISSAQLPKGNMPPPTPEFKALRRDVGYFTARGGSIGWLVNKDALAAVDTQFPDTAKLFLEGLPGRSGRKLDALINSHHHGDHTGGNGVFKPEVKMIVAHENVPVLQKARATQDKKLDNQVYADTTFAQTWRKDLGGETVALKYFGAAHTKGDIVTHFEKANVIHMGDLMFNRLYPVIDRPGGGVIRGWIGVLEKVAKEYPADAIYIFGHGSSKFGVTGSNKDLLVFRDFLSGLLDYTEKKIKAGEPKEKVVAIDRLPGFADFETNNRVQTGLSAAYDELTNKG